MEEAIKNVLPFLSEETMVALQHLLTDLGVRTAEDIDLLTAEDLRPVLPVVECRRLIRAFQKGNVNSVHL